MPPAAFSKSWTGGGKALIEGHPFFEELEVKHSFRPEGVCSRNIEFELDNGVIRNICFEGGCHGNLQGVSRLASGRRVEEVVGLLSGICCGEKGTSCPDQLSRAILQAQAAAGSGGQANNSLYTAK